MAVLALCVCIPDSAAAQAGSLEYAVKANYLYKFGPFVTWPPTAFASAASPFTVCVTGADPFGSDLEDAVRGQTVNGHPVVVQRFAAAPAAPPCHVVYIGRSTQQPVADVLAMLARYPVLTVTDERVGPTRGAIHLVISNGRVRFIADPARARASGLSLTSRLLELSAPVRGS